MLKIHLSIIGIVIGGLLAFASPAYAEFLSFNSKSSGTASDGAFTLTGGGATITCSALSSTAPLWSIENTKGELATTGPDFLASFPKLTECATEVAGTEIPVTTTECEFAVKQTKEEEKIDGALIKTCALKGEVSKAPCEITLEASTNKELKEMTVNYSGLESKNMILGFHVKNLTTLVHGAGCESAGIKATKEAAFEGSVEVPEASIKGPGAPFSIYLVSGQVATLKRSEERLISVRWELAVREAATPGEALQFSEDPASGGNFTFSRETFPFCKAKVYNTTQPECRMWVRLEKLPPANGTLTVTISVTWASQTSTETLTGVR